MKIISMLFPEEKLKALTLSYDDAVIHDIRLIDIMKKHGLKGTFNVCSGRFGNGGEYKLSGEELKKHILGNGMEVAVHGLYHRFMEELPDGVRSYEVIKDREQIEKTIGGIVRGMAYAFGSFDDKTVDTLKHAGIVYARTTKSTERFDIPSDWLRMPATCHHRNPRLFELADQFLEYSPKDAWRRRPQLFYLWGHSYEFSDNDNWDIIERFAEKMGGNEDIWYATNMEIYDYVTAFRSLVFNCEASIVHNPSAIKVWFHEEEKVYCINPGETITL